MSKIRMPAFKIFKGFRYEIDDDPIGGTLSMVYINPDGSYGEEIEDYTYDSDNYIVTIPNYKNGYSVLLKYECMKEGVHIENKAEDFSLRKIFNTEKAWDDTTFLNYLDKCSHIKSGDSKINNLKFDTVGDVLSMQIINDKCVVEFNHETYGHGLLIVPNYIDGVKEYETATLYTYTVTIQD